jgi:nucleotide-binding universal stress UspA family protein
MKKIIVPTDFSEFSENALKVAADIAKKHGSEIILLHMLDISDQLISITENTKRRELMYFMQLANKRFEELTAKPNLNGIKVTPVIKHFKVFEEINNAAKELKADIILMSSRGASGIKGYFVGSNTERVVRTAQIPVLVIKSEMKKFQPKTIVFACDFTAENVAPYKKVKKIAEFFGADLKLVYINTPNLKYKSTYEAREHMREFMSSAKISIKTESILVYNDYMIEEGIKNAAEDLNADMIAIPTHGRKGIDKMLSGSIGENVANTSDIPVLTIKI